jgi:hypothetical protein
MKVYEHIHGLFPANAALDLMPLPGESMVSSLWRFAWRNGLSAKELLRFCSSGLGYAKEGSDYSRSRAFDPDVFIDASGWINQSREINFIEPSSRHRHTWWCSHFRYCPVCLEHLYHSYWHQSKFISHCPLDGAALIDSCYCCRASLPEYGFQRAILSKPYTCHKCRGAISGVKINLSARVHYQQRAREFSEIIASIERWWFDATPLRKELETMIPSHRFRAYAPWMRPHSSLRYWIVAQVPPPERLPVLTSTLPPLVVLKWKVRLKPDDPMAFLFERRQSKFEKLVLARQVYRATLRRLGRTIQRSQPFDDAQYRRHQALPLEDFVRSSKHCNLQLLALIMLRRSYETYISSFEDSPEHAQLEDGNVGFPYGNEFALRLRICWRAQFIADYASFYWWLVAMRDGREGVNSFRREMATLCDADSSYDRQLGDLVSGTVAFPAVDGLDLGLFP